MPAFLRLTLALGGALCFATPALAQDASGEGATPNRIRSVQLFGDEECPKARDENEIVVCARVGESPYRIPKQFRNPPKEDAPNTAWATRVETIEEVNRAGMPNSCSPFGTGGQTGCTRLFLQQWMAEKRAQERRDSQVP